MFCVYMHGHIDVYRLCVCVQCIACILNSNKNVSLSFPLCLLVQHSRTNATITVKVDIINIMDIAYCIFPVLPTTTPASASFVGVAGCSNTHPFVGIVGYSIMDDMDASSVFEVASLVGNIDLSRTED